MGERTCSRPDCPDPHLAKGMCERHYRRVQRTGSAELPSRVGPPPCKVADCSGSHYGRGYCKTHWAQMARKGKISPIRRPKPKLPPKPKVLRIPWPEVCMAEKCAGRSRRVGYCAMHHSRLLRHGDLNRGRVILTLEERFWEKVDKDGPIPAKRPDLGPCWIWTGAKVPRGYGRFNVAKKRQRPAHCVSYEWAKGDVPEGLEIDHLCMTHSCVNPDHLEAVTHIVNLRRADIVYGIRTARTRCPQGHPYDEENTLPRKGGGRACRTCARDRGRTTARRAYARKKAAQVALLATAP